MIFFISKTLFLFYDRKMVLVNFWEIYSSDLKCQHRPLNTVPWSVLESSKYDFQTKLRRLSVPCISPAKSVCDYSSLDSGFDVDHGFI